MTMSQDEELIERLTEITTWPRGKLADQAGYVRAQCAIALTRLEALAQPVVGVERREDIERDIRIAIWNAGMNGGMGQDLSQAFIVRAMAEPTMTRALDALAASPSPVPTSLQNMQTSAGVVGDREAIGDS
jgi:hypothetical protein